MPTTTADVDAVLGVANRSIATINAAKQAADQYLSQQLALGRTVLEIMMDREYLNHLETIRVARRAGSGAVRVIETQMPPDLRPEVLPQIPGVGKTGAILEQITPLSPSGPVKTTVENIRQTLTLMGPVRYLQQMSIGAPAAIAGGVVVTGLAGTVTRQVLKAGTGSMVRTMQDSKEVEGWIRVTSDKPCSFCAMLSSRGPVYKTKQTAKGSNFSNTDMDFKVHDHCACVPQPVFEKDMPRHEWPGKAGEFRNFWDRTMKDHDFEYEPGMDASKEARRVFNREYRQSSYYEPNTSPVLSIEDYLRNEFPNVAMTTLTLPRTLTRLAA